MICIGSINAQKDFNEFYKAYKDKKGVTTINMNGLMKSILTDGDKDADELIKKTESLKIITTDGPHEEMMKDLENYFPKNMYPLLMEVKEGNETVSVIAKQTEKIIEEILFIT